VLEQRDGKLNHGSLSSITAAKKLGGTVHGFVAGSNVKAVAEEAAKVDGVEKIIVVENEAYEKVGPLIHSRLEPGADAIVTVGSSRKLRAAVGREYQERRLHARHCRPHGLREELDATGSSNAGLATSL